MSKAGQAIKKLRLDKGLSQEVLSGLAGFARTKLANIEKGSLDANEKVISQLESALGIKPGTISKLAEEMD